MRDDRGYGSHLMYNETDPFVVNFQYAPGFGIGSISAKTREEAFHHAMCLHLECVDWAEIVNQKEFDENDNPQMVLTREAVEKASIPWFEERGIKSWSFGVNVAVSPAGGFVSTVVEF